MATFAITDGARPGNKKRDAVLRSVIRRAVRYGYQYFELREPFLYELVPVLVEQMGGAFPELKTNAKTGARRYCARRRQSSSRPFRRGLVHFGEAAEKAKRKRG